MVVITMLVMKMMMFKWRYDRHSGNFSWSNCKWTRKNSGFQQDSNSASSFYDDDDCEDESDGNNNSCNIYDGDVDDVDAVWW